MHLEACIETLAEAKLAAKHNLNRVELCAALDLGGLTPTTALIRACAEVLEVHAMIRPRGGDFCYTPDELTLMVSEIEDAKNEGATGVVFGCLTAENLLDVEATKILTQKAKQLGLQSTFHRAIDFVPDQELVLEKLIALGINRVLTSGGKTTAAEGIEGITKLVRAANKRIEIMAGSGVSAQLVPALTAARVDAIHFTLRKKTGAKPLIGMGENYGVDEEKILGILKSLSGPFPFETA
jgi:copper homeostasis protein